MRKTFIVFSIAIVAYATGCKVFPRSEKKTAFPTPCVVLDNGIVHLEVAPEIGRITWFGWSHGGNLLWSGDYEKAREDRAKGEWGNYGGDKLWPAQQAKWPDIMPRSWPPDEFIDGSPWTVVKKEKLSVVIESPVSKYLGIQVRREIRLIRGAPEVVIKNTITRVEPNRYPVQIWTVTQVVPPTYVLLDIAEANSDGRLVTELCPGSIPLTKIMMNDTVAQFRTPTEKSRKIGALGQWIAGVYDACVLLQRTTYRKKALYPDKANVEVYSEPRYVEMEVLSPEVLIKPGEHISNRVTWRLLKKPEHMKADKLVEYLRGID